MPARAAYIAPIAKTQKNCQVQINIHKGPQTDGDVLKLHVRTYPPLAITRYLYNCQLNI